MKIMRPANHSLGERYDRDAIAAYTRAEESRDRRQERGR
jgi:hypothetical protein